MEHNYQCVTHKEMLSTDRGKGGVLILQEHPIEHYLDKDYILITKVQTRESRVQTRESRVQTRESRVQVQSTD